MHNNLFHKLQKLPKILGERFGLSMFPKRIPMIFLPGRQDHSLYMKKGPKHEKRPKYSLRTGPGKSVPDLVSQQRGWSFRALLQKPSKRLWKSTKLIW